MAIDHRILQQIGVNNNNQVLSTFQNALNAAQNRKSQQQSIINQQGQNERAGQLFPFQLQEAQQGFDINRQGINKRRADQRLSSIHITGQRLKPILLSGDIEAAKKFLLDNISQIQTRIEQGSGEDVTESMETLAKLQAGDIQGALGDIDAVAGLINQASGRGATAQQREFTDLLRIAQDPNATELEQNSARRKLGDLAREGVVSKEEKLAGSEDLTTSVAKSQAEIEGAKAAAKTTSKGTAARQEGFIDSGIEAADSVNNIKRSIELLEAVKTGGFDNAALKAKQFFGIEGADEGELSARLGISILAQLKPIFGSAFTEREGARLDRISARFGASPETNKRLLKDALVIAERSARRGHAAAIKSGDTFAAEEIQTVLDSFKSTPTPPPPSAAPQEGAANTGVQESTGGFSEGQTATDASGAKAIFTNGSWVIQ